MANYCNICKTRRPASGTNMLVLGDEWIEFCRPCGEKEKLTNSETGEQKSIVEVFKLLGNEPIWEDEGLLGRDYLTEEADIALE